MPNRLLSRVARLERKFNPKRRSLSRLALDLYATAVAVDDLSGDRQAQTRASFLRGEERFKQTCLRFRVHAGAMIRDDDAGAFLSVRSGAINRYGARTGIEQLRRNLYRRLWLAGIDGVAD